MALTGRDTLPKQLASRKMAGRKARDDTYKRRAKNRIGKLVDN